jgi:peptidoglycan/xylan/chitin deacetylase (PgdA/CDA1 family)
MSAILWSIDTIDWKTHSIVNNIKSIENVQDGDIIIMHDIHETSVASIPTIIKILKEK